MGEQTEHSDKGKEVKQVGMESGGRGREACVSGFLQLKIWHNDPVNIDAVHEDDPSCGGTKTPGGPFSWLGQQKGKGNKEVTYD